MTRQGRGRAVAAVLSVLVAGVAVVGRSARARPAAAADRRPEPARRSGWPVRRRPCPPGPRWWGRRTPSATVTVDVALSPRDPAALDAFVPAVSTPGSPEYHHYLAPGQFASTFGPTAATVAATRAWLASAGLQSGHHLARRSAHPGHRDHRPDGAGPRRVPGVRPAGRRPGGPVHPTAPGGALGPGHVGGRGGRSVHRGHAPAPAGADRRGGIDRFGPGPTGAHPGRGAGRRPGDVLVGRVHRRSGAYTANQLASAYGLSTLYGRGRTAPGRPSASTSWSRTRRRTSPPTRAATASPRRSPTPRSTVVPGPPPRRVRRPWTSRT